MVDKLEGTNLFNLMHEGAMYQFIDNKVTEVVRHGDELLPITDPKINQIVGQLVLDLYED